MKSIVPLLILIFCSDGSGNPFLRGRMLLHSNEWKEIENGLWWHTFEKYNSWPYFMYSVCTNVSISDTRGASCCRNLMGVEVYNYEICSKEWIPQLISGNTISNNIQYLKYDFFPLTNRDVCQQWRTTYYKDGYQIYITTDFAGNSSCPNELKIHMYEDVHKFIYPDTDKTGYSCNRMIYIGVEDPRGSLKHFQWFLQYLYVYFYQSHFKAYKDFLKSLQNESILQY